MTKQAEQEGRAALAVMCLGLARTELRDHGRKFMKPHEDVYDSATQYGSSMKLTRAEIIEADKSTQENNGA